ncbi:50S ribosomal protein L33 [Patescibacteria group bacterium]|nr:50S ribosomal protein L33 [Patescibacteria group bacterium]MBU1758428.1 50S ribosomal protein L33 [Patescibacteria group bacterium]
MQCSECKATNYQTMLNKVNTGKIELSKYCKKCKKHTKHNSKEKLK